MAIILLLLSTIFPEDITNDSLSVLIKERTDLILKEVYIDPLSELYLIGTTIDYQYEDYQKGIYETLWSSSFSAIWSKRSGAWYAKTLSGLGGKK